MWYVVSVRSANCDPPFSVALVWFPDRRKTTKMCTSEVALRPKHPKSKNEKRKTNSFFVFLTSLLKTKNEKGISFSFANLKTKNEKGIRYRFFVRKFENEKRKNGIYTDRNSLHGGLSQPENSNW